MTLFDLILTFLTSVKKIWLDDVISQTNGTIDICVQNDPENVCSTACL